MTDGETSAPTLAAAPAPAPRVPALSVVIPVYNSELTLPDLCARLAATLPALAPVYEAILVNDSSRDGSWGVITHLAGQYPWLRAINLMRNFGQHNALLCGIRAARYPIIVTIDDDLQHPPEEMPRLLARLDDGYDVVYGTPQQEQHGFLRDLASQVTKMALRSAMGADIARNVTAFRMFRTPLRNAFANYQGPFVSIDVLLTWGTTRFAAVPVRHDPRRAGASNYTFRKLVTHALNMVTGFSTLPLQLASIVGFGFTLFGVAILLYVLARYLISGGSVPGFPFLASVIVIFAGAQLFALGIMGEYLARIHFRIMDRPAYVIREQIDSTPAP
jgi:glycosyltransferase involved in cell wall biosynthesis